MSRNLSPTEPKTKLVNSHIGLAFTETPQLKPGFDHRCVHSLTLAPTCDNFIRALACSEEISYVHSFANTPTDASRDKYLKFWLWRTVQLCIDKDLWHNTGRAIVSLSRICHFINVVSERLPALW